MATVINSGGSGGESTSPFAEITLLAGDGNITCANDTPTSITFVNENPNNTAGYADLVTDNDRITFPNGGTFTLVAQGTFLFNATGTRQIFTQRFNSSDVLQELSSNDTRTALTVSGNKTSPLGVNTINTSAGDYITMTARQTSGGNLDVESAKIVVYG